MTRNAAGAETRPPRIVMSVIVREGRCLTDRDLAVTRPPDPKINYYFELQPVIS